jgi:hypothetical protein
MKIPHLLKGIIILVFLVLAMGGCGPSVKIIKPSNLGLEMGSPLKGISPKTFVIDGFTDVRGVEPSLVSTYPWQLKMEKPVTEIIEESIRQELERNGHKCVSRAAAAQADFKITGSVYQYWSTFVRGPGGFVLYTTGNVGLKIMATHLKPEARDFSKKYDGTQQYSSALGIRYDQQMEVLHQAFLNTLRDFTTDPDFINFLSGP